MLKTEIKNSNTIKIIKYHNGKVWVESEGEGKGSIFYIELPLG